MRLIVTAFMTVDGVMEGPGFDEHRDGKNAWALRVQNEEDAWFNRDQVFSAEAFLLGRKTYQIWAAFWPTATGDEELARWINEIPKYVVSTTLKSADWSNSTLISDDVVGAVNQLKDQPGGDLLVYGSADLVDGLLKHELVDEYRLLVYPVILGSGRHLFRDGIDIHHLRLVGSRTFSSGVVLLTYQPEQEAPTSRYVEDYSWTQEQVHSMQAAQNIDRVLSTVLFTDLVDSTRRAAALGDRAWRELMDRHDEVARTDVSRWIGQYVKSTSDGILDTFDAPTRALRCAFDLRDDFARLGLEMRAAVHTGEIERRGADVGGIGVHIASRALTEASTAQVVVTRTVRDLATGTDLAFAPLGSVSLRGFPADGSYSKHRSVDRPLRLSSSPNRPEGELAACPAIAQEPSPRSRQPRKVAVPAPIHEVCAVVRMRSALRSSPSGSPSPSPPARTGRPGPGTSGHGYPPPDEPARG